MALFAATLAWNPLGIGDTWTGVVLGCSGFMLLAFVAAMTDFFTDWPWTTDDYMREHEAEQRRLRQAVVEGVLICDAVDMTVLTTVAKQSRIAAEPVRVEEEQGATTTGGLEGGRSGFLARLTREKRSDRREFYELTQDPNALLLQVIAKLHDDDKLLTDLDEVRTAGALSSAAIDEIIRAAKENEALTEARKAVLALQDDAFREAKVENWRAVTEAPRFALVESEWEVLRLEEGADEDLLFLDLRKLRRVEYPDRYMYDDQETRTTIDMPSDLAMWMRISKAHLTEVGKARLTPGTTVAAGVFAMTSRVDTNSEGVDALELTPVAVFARVGR